ncbi:hypothetical protein BDB01DRAFT_812561 [Pilobolus umbonatus]|nr:hypothetical protein BDB01DRAFT_812561 [Pilobolus umbonatus]
MSKRSFISVYQDADNKHEDDNYEDPFPVYLEGIDKALAPFCPTSSTRVLKALRMANVGISDKLIDLGSGDGRFVTAAVSEFNVLKAVGIESDASLIETSRLLAHQVLPTAKEDRVSFILGDLTALPKIVEDIDWTVIVLFLLPDHTDKFSDLLLRYYHRGARIISMVFNLNEIPELNLLTSDEPDGIYVYGISR